MLLHPGAAAPHFEARLIVQHAGFTGTNKSRLHSVVTSFL
jgi:hypothetical protein